MQQPPKAYKNLEFLSTPAARTIRMLCEYEEPRQRFRDQDVKDTIVFFGSARIRSPEKIGTEHPVPLDRYYGEARELARRLTEWSMGLSGSRRYTICTGGGPGVMEAANRGAADVPGGRSVGLCISLPFEEKMNPYVTPELGFEFHYFFMRKYWFLYLAKAMVLFPGGFGTMDEMFEMLTLRQTRKVTKPIPTVLYGREYWDQVLHLDAMMKWGTISERDLDLVHRADSVDDAFQYLVSSLENATLNTEEAAR